CGHDEAWPSEAQGELITDTEPPLAAWVAFFEVVNFEQEQLRYSFINRREIWYGDGRLGKTRGAK
ncbi:MAG: hypothetical protein U1C55_00880, partial [Smithellaceae bacterium]|nr:hypothetical protein [Smithellaceae bacterium]